MKTLLMIGAFTLAFCILSGIAFAAPVVSLGAGVFMLFTGGALAGMRWKQWGGVGVTSSATGLMVVGVAAFAMFAESSKRDRQVAEQARAAEQQAVAATAEAARIEALQASAPEILTRVIAKCDEADGHRRERRYVAAGAAIMSVSGDLESLRQIPTPPAGTPEAIARANQLMTELGPLSAAEEAMAAGVSARDAEHADAIVANQAYGAALVRLQQPFPAEAAHLERDRPRLVRTLESQQRRVHNDAVELATRQDIESRGLVVVSARALANEYRSNEVAANSLYNGRRLAVEGRVQAVRVDFVGNPIVELRTSNQFMPVDARMSNSGDAARLSPGNDVVLDCEGNGMSIGRPQLGSCQMLQFSH